MSLYLSEIERQLVKLNVRRDRTNFWSETGNLVCEHTGGWCLDSVVPVIVVVAQSVGEIQDRHLANVWWVFSNIEVCWFHTTLCNRVWYKEKVKLTVNYFWLLNETLINVSTLGRIVNKLLTVAVGLLEESLANSLIHDNKRNLWGIVLILWFFGTLFICQ